MLGWKLAACSATYACAGDQDCVSGGAGGMCQPTGFCSFEDAECESGQRYGGLAPKGLADECVPSPSGETDTADDPASTTSEDPGTSSLPGDTGTLAIDGSTSAMAEPSSDTGGDDESSTTAGPAACCHAGCEAETCARGPCESMVVGGPLSGVEAIGVAAIGDSVVWSTGWGLTLQLVDLASGTNEQLVEIADNSYVTKIAADDTHVYVLDHGTGVVKRASVPGGVVEVVTQVPGGVAEFAGLAVADEHVYFGMRASGGVWRAAKDLSDQAQAEPVAEAGNPHDVAVDDTHVYWADVMSQEIRRLALADIGAGMTGEVVVHASEVGALRVDGDYVVYGDAGSVMRALKSGTDRSVTTLATGQGWIWALEVDDVHAYWTSADGGFLGRAAKDGSDEPQQRALAVEPWGLALGCDVVYWASRDDGMQSLNAMPK
jgi:hypothetical protein